jgi:hypothetical protein
MKYKTPFYPMRLTDTHSDATVESTTFGFFLLNLIHLIGVFRFGKLSNFNTLVFQMKVFQMKATQMKGTFWWVGIKTHFVNSPICI